MSQRPSARGCPSGPTVCSLRTAIPTVVVESEGPRWRSFGASSRRRTRTRRTRSPSSSGRTVRTAARSRLLAGLIWQGLRVLVLVTTNEEIRTLQLRPRGAALRTSSSPRSTRTRPPPGGSGTAFRPPIRGRPSWPISTPHCPATRARRAYGRRGFGDWTLLGPSDRLHDWLADARVRSPRPAYARRGALAWPGCCSGCRLRPA
jgi:hypothetical protein